MPETDSIRTYAERQLRYLDDDSTINARLMENLLYDNEAGRKELQKMEFNALKETCRSLLKELASAREQGFNECQREAVGAVLFNMDRSQILADIEALTPSTPQPTSEPHAS